MPAHDTPVGLPDFFRAGDVLPFIGDEPGQANEVLRMRTWLEDTIALHSNRNVEQVKKDIERDKILTAPMAVEYGLVDQVLESRKAGTAVESASSGS